MSEKRFIKGRELYDGLIEHGYNGKGEHFNTGFRCVEKYAAINDPGDDDCYERILYAATAKGLVKRTLVCHDRGRSSYCFNSSKEGSATRP